MNLYRGISPLEFEFVRRSGLIFSKDNVWRQDSTWHLSRPRTFLTRNREQADLFATGAYISGYGATGCIARCYGAGRINGLTTKAYTLQIDIPESGNRTDTEFAERGDDEVYTTQPIPSNSRVRQQARKR